MSKSSQPVENEADDSGRNRKTQPLAPPALGEDERIDAKQVSVNVNERTATISGVDRRVRLNEYHRQLGIRLTIHGTHHAHSDGIAQPFGISEREHDLSLVDRVFGINGQIG